MSHDQHWKSVEATFKVFPDFRSELLGLVAEGDWRVRSSRCWSSATGHILDAGQGCRLTPSDALVGHRWSTPGEEPQVDPAGPIQLPNLLGALPGATAAPTKMMRLWMDNAGMPTVPEFIEMAQGLGVTFFACSTTMGVMRVTEDDLIK